MAESSQTAREFKQAEVPESYYEFLERPIVMSLSTILPEGTPQITPVWFNFDPEEGAIYFNTAQGRLKQKAIATNPYVAMLILDPDDAYHYVQIRGPVVEASEERGREHINLLAKKYRGLDEYPGPKDEVRIRYKVVPEHVLARGG